MTQTEQQNVPELRFPGFDAEWKTAPISGWLSKVIDYRGKAPPKTEAGIPLITARNVRMGYLDFAADEYIDSILFETWMNRGRPNPGDVMFTTEAPLGNVAQFPAEGVYALGQRIITLQTDREHCDSGFLFQTLLGPRMQRKVDARGTGSTAKGIKSRLFVKIPMDAPTPPEQRKIAGFLGAVDERIAQVTRKKALLEDYKKGCMQQIFSQSIRFKDDQGNDFPDWKEKRLGEVTDCLDNKRKPLNSTEREQMKGDIPYYGANGQVDSISRYIFEEPLVLLAEDGGNFDEYSTRPIAQKIEGKSWVNNHAHILKAKPNKLVHDYLFQTLVHRDIRKYINGSSRAKLNKSDMLSIVIEYPHLNEQQKIADFLTAIDTKIDLAAQELAHTLTFKKGLLQQMFV